MIRAATALAAVTLSASPLAGCDVQIRERYRDAEAAVRGWLGIAGPTAPDALARWAADHAVPFTVAQPVGETVLRHYLVPVAELDSALDEAIRAALFPDGVLRALSGRGAGAPAGAEVTIGELEQLHFLFTVAPGNALCGTALEPCDAAERIALVATLHTPAPEQGPRISRVLMIRFDEVVESGAMVVQNGADSADVCGFDREAALVPQHVAGGCRAALTLRFAAERGFGVTRQGVLIPTGPDAMRRYAREAIRQSFHRDGHFRGRLHAAPEAAE